MPTDIAQYAAVSASSTFAVYILVTFIRSPLELALKPNDPLHDWAVRLLACLFGVLVVVAASGALGHLITGQAWFVAVSQGVLAGLSAVGTYHLVNTGADSPTTPQPAVEAPGALLPVPAAQSPASAPITPPTQPGGQGGAA